jgi:hypothetical protein
MGSSVPVVGGKIIGSQAPIGSRRLDQVQIRRRRMKTAKTMKALYHFRDSILNDSDKDLSMEFEVQSTLQTQKKLQIIDILIDLKISIEKIESNVILAEDGKIYQIQKPKGPSFNVGGNNISQIVE